jgi:hypothetical protein
MSGKSILCIEVDGILGMRKMKRPGKAIFSFGYGNKMNMICHQRVRPDPNTMILASIFKRSKVHQTIGVIVKHGISANSTLTDVMRTLRQHTSTRSRHRNSVGWFRGGLAQSIKKGKKGPDVSFPFFS